MIEPQVLGKTLKELKKKKLQLKDKIVQLSS